MAKAKKSEIIQGTEKEFLDAFKQLTYSRSSWQVWEDLMTVMACSISNAVDKRPEKFKDREERYERAIKNLGGRDIPAQIFAIVVMALEKNPDQDFLGTLYMSLNLGSHWHGQFFTPYHVSKFISKAVNVDSAEEQIKDKGYISICDPCVGAGALLIAAANTMKEAKINYHYHAVFVGQDIDRVVAMMAYIQLSLLGCPGYIIVGNSLTNPPTGHILFPRNTDEQNVWITPLFMHEVWEMRRAVALTQGLTYENESTEKEVKQTMKTEIKHFTKDEPYGQIWEQVVTEYLRKWYKKDCGEYDLTVLETTYKVLKRKETTVFYNAEETALFDVGNERLEKEYKLLMLKDVEENKESEDSEENNANKFKDEMENADLEKKEIGCEIGGASGEKPEDNYKNNIQTDNVISADLTDVKEKAKEKLEKELAEDSDNTFAKPIIGYLLKRCEEDEGLSQDVMQEHKTWRKCFDYINEKARNQAVGNRGVVHVPDEVVYEWAEDYYHKDDKAEEEKKARKVAERKAKQEKEAAERKDKKNTSKTERKEDITKEQSKPKKSGKDMEGQLDLFSMMEV